MILYVLRYYPALSETFVVQELRALVARGERVAVLALGTREDGAPADAVPEVTVLRPPRGLEGVALLPFAGRGSKRGARIAWAAHQLEGKVRRIHAHFAGEAGEWAADLSQVLGVPYGVTVHAVDLFRPRPRLAEVLAGATPVVTVCAHHQAWMRRVYGVEAVVVRCGVEPERFAQARPAEGRSVVCVARDVPKKGLDDLVQATTAVRAPLQLVSDGARLARPGVVVGSLSHSEVPAALARAHLFALPCRVAADGDRDGIPVALLEAMAAGLPVVTTAVAGIPEVVDAEVGWLVPADDPEAFAAALAEALADPEERRRRGEAGRRRIVERGLTVAQQVEGLRMAWREEAAWARR